MHIAVTVNDGLGCLVVARPVDTALKPVRACATVVSSRYSAWRVPAILWFPAYAGMMVGGVLVPGMLCGFL